MKEVIESITTDESGNQTVIKISSIYEVTGCVNCPFLKIGEDRYGTVYACKHEVFGSIGVPYEFDSGLSKIPEYPPLGCDIIKHPLVLMLSNEIDIEYKELSSALENLGLEINYYKEV